MHSADIIAEVVVVEGSLFNNTIIPANLITIIEDFKVIIGDDIAS